ncbi:MAG: DNA polymerase III subunit beta [Candidatus Pacebacteria bacterium]|nr:DNA polymerase III subunit beta [Candidatus Paceibacterota bacterium]
MKLTIIYEKLKEGIKTVERLAQKSLTLPILQNILLKTEKNFLSFSATNLEVGIKYWSLSKNEKEGQVAVPARVLSQLVDFLPDKSVNLETHENNLLITCQNHKTTIKGFSAEEFPIIPEIKEGEKISLPCAEFCQALNQVADIASPSVARPEISGVYFSFEKDLIKIVATDSFRLGEQKLYIKSQLSQGYSLILPQQTVKEVINIFSQKDGDLKIYFSPNQILFEFPMPEMAHPQVQLISRLIEGNYPDYEAIIPQKTTTQMLVQRNEFINQIKSASLFSGKTNEILFKIDPKKEKIEILSQNSDLGDYQSSLPAKIKGKETEISFNFRFLIDGLLKINTSEVSFELTDGEGPAILKPVGENKFVYIAMPIKKG